jgi:hypothetical protein
MLTNCQGLIGSGRGLILRYYVGIRLEGLRKPTYTSTRIAGRRGRESNPEPPEYQVGVLIFRYYPKICLEGLRKTTKNLR